MATGQKNGATDYLIYYNNISGNLQEVCQEFLKKAKKICPPLPVGSFFDPIHHFVKEISPKSIDKRAGSCYNILVKKMTH